MYTQCSPAWRKCRASKTLRYPQAGLPHPEKVKRESGALLPACGAALPGSGLELAKFKRKDLHPRLLYPAKLSFRMEGKIKCFSDKVKLKKFIITKPLLYEMLKGVT